MLKLIRNKFGDGSKRDESHSSTRAAADAFLARKEGQSRKESAQIKAEPLGAWFWIGATIAVVAVLGLAVLAVDRFWPVLPRCRAESSDFPDRWENRNFGEKATIQCHLGRRDAGPGKIGYVITAEVGAGKMAQDKSVPAERAGVCHVEMRNSEGRVLLDRDISCTMLASSGTGGGYFGEVPLKGRYIATVTYSYKGRIIGQRVSRRL